MLHRTDVTFRVSHVEATPDRLAVRDSLAARLNKDADEVVIRKLDTKFGMRTTYGEAKVYESPVQAKEVEQAHMLARNKIAVGEGGETITESAEEPAPAADEPEAEPETEPEAEAEPADEPEADAEPEEDEPEAGDASDDEEADTDDEAEAADVDDEDTDADAAEDEAAEEDADEAADEDEDEE